MMWNVALEAYAFLFVMYHFDERRYVLTVMRAVYEFMERYLFTRAKNTQQAPAVVL